MAKQHRCSCCNRELTREERHFYGKTCDGCEREETEDLDDWRHGRSENPEFDQRYASDRDEPVVH